MVARLEWFFLVLLGSRTTLKKTSWGVNFWNTRTLILGGAIRFFLFHNSYNEMKKQNAEFKDNVLLGIKVAPGVSSYLKYSKINVKKIDFGNKEHTTDQKMGVSVLLRLFTSSNEVCNAAYALKRIHEQNSNFERP